MKAEDKIFRLYALSTKEQGEIETPRHRFVRITPHYSLVYTDGARPENSVEIGPESLFRLTPEDKQWMTDCAAIMLAEEVAKKQAACLVQLGEKVAELEKALQAARDETPEQEETEETQIE